MDKTGLEVSRGLDLVESLKRIVSDFAKKEELLVRSLHSRRYALNRKAQDLASKDEQTLAARIAETESLFDAEEERVRDIYETRRLRIEHLHADAIRTLPKRAHDARENWLGNQQVKLRQTERKRSQDLEAAAASLADFSAKLDEEQGKLKELKRRARTCFAGYWAFLRMLARKTKVSAQNVETTDCDRALETIRADLKSAEVQINAFGKLLLPLIFRYAPTPLLTIIIATGALVQLFRNGFDAKSYVTIGGISGVVLAVVWFVHYLGTRQSKSAANALAETLGNASRTLSACRQSSAAKYEQECQRIQQEFERAHAEIAEQWSRAGTIEIEFANAAQKKLAKQVPRISSNLEKYSRPRIDRILTERAARIEALTREAQTRKEEHTLSQEGELTELAAAEAAQWNTLEAEWKQAITPIYEAVETMNREAAERFPEWDKELLERWTPPETFVTDAKFAHLNVDVLKLAVSVPKDPRLALPGPAQLSIPLALTFPEEGSLLFETKESGNTTLTGALNNIVLRLLMATPPGKITFTIIDPVGLGQNFAGLMHLTDYEESLINRRIWTQHDQIETRLAELNEHIEKVIQMYLRNEYATITQYNEQAGSVAEKYHFLVIADFPAQFTETAARRLQSIATSGPRCGVFTLIHWDERQQLPDGFVPDELRKNSISIRGERNSFCIDKKQPEPGTTLVFDPPPDAELSANLVHKLGKSSIDSNRVEVPFAQIVPKASEMWTGDTTSELRVPVGRTGATKFQYLAIGKGTRQHALFVGKTGSGKSTLFHVIITNLALYCSPDQVEFYLIDFKKGVEFKCYATQRLPHARVVAIESDREFALSVLQRVDDELKRRGDMFRKLGVQDIAGYKKAGGTEPVPRTLLIIDEFQEFFVEDDTIAQNASLLFDRIVRQGRAFGIHVLLGSQTLGGAYTLARATLGQMVIRVALQCNEADAYLIMDENNSAPRLLSRPGEGIYNDAAGAVEGNSPFQVVWLADSERDSWLEKVHELAEEHHDHHEGPIVFEGNAPADIRDNHLLQKLLDTEPATVPVIARCWLGAPNSIKGPTEAVFSAQSGSNLLIVGQRDEAALTILGVSILALAAQYPLGAAKFVFLQGASPGSPDEAFISQIAAAIPHKLLIVRAPDVADAMNAISVELKARLGGEERATDAARTFLFIHGLHKFKKLRQEDDFSFSTSESEASPGAQFNDLITEGSAHGLHIIATVDTFNNVSRFISRKALSEFEMRVVFQMSANDSASLIDSPKAGNLGLHRALFYSEREGTLETFRPYAMPDAEWISRAGKKFARLHV